MYYKRNAYRRFDADASVVMTEDEESEVSELVAEFSSMGFTSSAEVSRYIRDHNFGCRYPNISGFLELTKENDIGDVDTWEFEGGIKPKFYREICRRLELGNNGSGARVTGFESYRQRESPEYYL